MITARPAGVAARDTGDEVVSGGRAGAAPAARRRRDLAWVGVLPFVAFLVVFLVWPASTVFREAVRADGGGVALDALGRAVSGQYRSSFYASLRLSLYTAALGTVLGVLLAYAAATARRPRWLRSAVTAFSGVAANLGGIPLAFAFVAAIGAQGLVTKVLGEAGVEPYGPGFYYSFWGLVVIYLYFQIPLMVLVSLPAIDGLRPAWREAAANLGATPFTYWRRVGLPVLAPSILGGFLLLFANAFSAYATAYAVSTGSSNIVPVQIRFFLQGNTITGQGQLGYALAAWMIVVMAVCMGGYLLLRRRAERWRR